MIRSRLAFSLMLLCPGLALAQEKSPAAPPRIEAAPVITWHTTFNEAMKEARARSKPVLLLFSGDSWDVDSQAFNEKLLSKPAFKEWASNVFVLCKVDVEKPKVIKLGQGVNRVRIQIARATHNSLASKFGIDFLPTLIVLTPSGTDVGRLSWKAKDKTVGPALEKLENILETYHHLQELQASLPNAKGLERAKIHEELATMAWNRRDIASGAAHSEKYIQLDAENSLERCAYHAAMLALTFLKDNQIERSNAYGKIVRELDPDNAGHMLEKYILGLTYKKIHTKEYKAIRVLLGELNPETVKNLTFYHYVLGWTAFFQQDYKTARESLTYVAKNGEDDHHRKVAMMFLEKIPKVGP